MMKIYICPSCGKTNLASRRKVVVCHKCGDRMQLTNLELKKFSEMNEKEREDYAMGWLYIHSCKGNA